MTERISLVEAYDNRDVIAQLVRLRDDVDELLNILKDIDPNGDLTNVVTKTGDQTIDGVKTFIGQIVADCDIIQNGAAYETHAEQVYSVNDLIVTRDGQITGLTPGDLSGFHVKKYNGVDDSRLGVDSTGTMRVGDVGSEQPLMTRDEVADLTNGQSLVWDSVNWKAITQSIPADISAALSDKQDTIMVTSGTGTNGPARSAGTCKWVQYGKVVVVTINGLDTVTTGVNQTIFTDLPVAAHYAGCTVTDGGGTNTALLQLSEGTGTLNINNTTSNTGFYGSLTYIAQ